MNIFVCKYVRILVVITVRHKSSQKGAQDKCAKFYFIENFRISDNNRNNNNNSNKERETIT